MFAHESTVETTQHKFGEWTITSCQSHIMTKNQRDHYESELTLPHLPDMVFSQNSLRLIHESGFGILFHPIDALRTVNDHEDQLQVAMAEEWQKAREANLHIKRIVKPFDWTFTPVDYFGTEIKTETGESFVIETTNDQIDYEKLKQREAINFFEDLILYEDELDDNGCSKLSVKIRVMPNSLFCLLRFYLRVDHTMVRIHDTRFYFERGNNFILREISKRESMASQLQLPQSAWHDQNEIGNHLRLISTKTEKLLFPTKSSEVF